MNAKSLRQSKTLLGEAVLTAANFKHKHFYMRSFIDQFPCDLIGGRDRTPAVFAEVEVRGMHTIKMDICKRHKFFRSRKWVRRFFEHTDARPGDIVQVHQLAPYRYEVSLRKNS